MLREGPPIGAIALEFVGAALVFELVLHLARWVVS